MVDVKDKNVFLCGPMTGLPSYNVEKFAAANKFLRNLGADRVYDPAFKWYTSLVSGYECTDHDACMRRTIGELTIGTNDGHAYYDLLVTLDGWKDSEGAKTEVEVARACGIPVYELQDVVGS